MTTQRKTCRLQFTTTAPCPSRLRRAILRRRKFTRHVAFVDRRRELGIVYWRLVWILWHDLLRDQESSCFSTSLQSFRCDTLEQRLTAANGTSIV